MRVLIADKLSEHVLAALEATACVVHSDPGLKDEALVAALQSHDPDVLVVRSTKVQDPHFEAARSLSLVIRGGAGVNTIAVDTASRRGIYVANCPGKNAVAVAELTMAHLLNMDRRVADNVSALRDGRWAKKEFGKARGLYGRTLAVLGLGRIGQEVVARARAFGMPVRAWSRSLTPELAEELDIKRCATPLEAATGADALTVHVALNDDTRGLVSAELLGVLNPGAYVINTSRGGVVDEVALVAAIEARGLRAGLDVFADEPAASDNEFASGIRHQAGVYGTHHIGASTDQASEAVGDEVVRIITHYQSTGTVLNCVNLAVHSPATHVLVVRHADAVGVLAGVLDALRKAGINVQEMENIVFRGAEAACARIQLDRAPAAAVIARIETPPEVFAASLVAL